MDDLASGKSMCSLASTIEKQGILTVISHQSSVISFLDWGWKSERKIWRQFTPKTIKNTVALQFA
jgi:hypothetical protein